MREDVVLVGETGDEIGVADKLEAHRSGRLHRAVSVFIVRGDRLLLQRRAPGKYHFGGLWTNTCCTHPRPGESPLAAGERRLPEEMGIAAAELHEVGHFVYTALDPVSGLTEHEFDHVLIGSAEGDPAPDPAEVAEWRWVELDDLRRRLSVEPDRFTPWLGPALDLVTQA
jgi:isopentenyl-diphosphate delta-isomerase